MPNVFLIQVNDRSYHRLRAENIYENPVWQRKHRDRAEGELDVGDTVLFYCTGDVPRYALSLALYGQVTDLSADKTRLTFGDLKWLMPAVPRDRILSLVADGQLEDAFGSCGAQGFNIARLEPESLTKILEIAEGSATEAPTTGALDALVERRLEDYIVQYWASIDFGSPLRLYQENREAVGQQYDTREVGIIDLLCEDTSNGDIVVIELKKGRQSDEVVGQLARYMGWAKAHLANGRRVRGIILAPDFDAKLRYAAAAIPDVSRLRYRTRFEVEPED